MILALALALSLLIGVALGLLGGGGSILTLPILTYALAMSPKAAIASSLFVVAVTSSVGVIAHARAGRVRWRIGALFGAAGMVGAFLGGRIAAYLPGRLLMVLFALMMVATAVAMLRGRRPAAAAPAPEAVASAAAPAGEGGRATLLVVTEGLVVGLVTGVVGAGGGFLVVPALVLLGGLGMEAAVGTSLLVIAMKSFAGFAGHLGHVEVDWRITALVTGAAVLGSLAGGRLVGRISPATLRRGFGGFVLVMAAVVLGSELL